jgi:hypothetical protein
MPPDRTEYYLRPGCLESLPACAMSHAIDSITG